MLDTLIKVLSIVFKPLFDASREAVLKSSDPKRKMAKSLLKLYEDLESVEYYSLLLFQSVEEYISTNWVAWTVARNRKQHIASTSEKLREATNNLGHSLHSLYLMLNIHSPEFLGHLIGIFHGKKNLYAGRIMATPQAFYDASTSREGTLSLLNPKDEITTIEYSSLLLSDFYHHPEQIKKNYLIAVDIDNKEQVAQILDRTRPLLNEFARIKGTLKDFIKANISIEDFF